MALMHDWFRRTALLGLVAVTMLFLSTNETFAQSPNYPCYGIGPWMMSGSLGWIGGIFMMFFWVLLLVSAVLFIRWLVSAGGTRTPAGHTPQLTQAPAESAMEILKKRYAMGEITKEQFDLMRRDLE